MNGHSIGVGHIVVAVQTLAQMHISSRAFGSCSRAACRLIINQCIVRLATKLGLKISINCQILIEDSLLLAVPAKVDEAIAAFKYIPYTSLTKSAKIKSLLSNEEFVINAQGGLTSKQLDRKNERFISFSDWLGASRVMEERLRVHWGNARAEAFAEHHRIVTELERTHGWAVAVDYDIQQRDFVHVNPRHDLSTLDTQCLTLTTSRLIIETAGTLQHHGASSSSNHSHQGPASAHGSPTKRSAPDSGFSSNGYRNAKHQKLGNNMCFRCGFAGHLPADCKAESTSAGKATARIAAGARSKHALMGPNNRMYCYNWARESTCTFGSNCVNAHACSICEDQTHGAKTCPRAGVRPQ